MYEIERRFMVRDDIKQIVHHEQVRNMNQPIGLEEIKQVFMPDTGEWSIRFRSSAIVLDKGASDTRSLTRIPRLSADHVITLKRRDHHNPLVAIEIEKPATEAEFEFACTLAHHAPLVKLRWSIPGTRWVIDRFLNPELENLVIAEVELGHPDEGFENGPTGWYVPPWLGQEITGEGRWSNRSLAHFKLGR